MVQRQSPGGVAAATAADTSDGKLASTLDMDTLATAAVLGLGSLTLLGGGLVLVGGGLLLLSGAIFLLAQPPPPVPMASLDAQAAELGGGRLPAGQDGSAHANFK